MKFKVTGWHKKRGNLVRIEDTVQGIDTCKQAIAKASIKYPKYNELSVTPLKKGQE